MVYSTRYTEIRLLNWYASSGVEYMAYGVKYVWYTEDRDPTNHVVSAILLVWGLRMLKQDPYAVDFSSPTTYISKQIYPLTCIPTYLSTYLSICLSIYI